MEELLKLRHFTIRFDVPGAHLYAVKKVGFSISQNEIVGIVGESGSGKTQLFLGLLGLLASNGQAFGEALYRGVDLLKLDTSALNRFRGKEIAFIFQESSDALHPTRKIGPQLCEILEHHYEISRREAEARTVDYLDLVQMPRAKSCLNCYPHELSGGMRQRVLIALSLLCKPRLLIADEPTTALDVSIQAQILHILKEVKREIGMSLVLISHDFGVISGMADRIMVMYGGSIMESGTTEQIVYSPRHPYTQALASLFPTKWERGKRLWCIDGSPPSPTEGLVGCPFQQRCVHSDSRCEFVEFVGDVERHFHFSACPFK